MLLGNGCEEWFNHLLEPWVHYVPLSNDLSNLREQVQWIHENPEEVKTIAMNGQAFYDKWLSFDGTTAYIAALQRAMSRGL